MHLKRKNKNNIGCVISHEYIQYFGIFLLYLREHIIDINPECTLIRQTIVERSNLQFLRTGYDIYLKKKSNEKVQYHNHKIGNILHSCLFILPSSIKSCNHFEPSLLFKIWDVTWWLSLTLNGDAPLEAADEIPT